jgi:HD-like signal output (HDOD) protein
MSRRIHSVPECLAIVGLNHVRTMAHASATKASLRAVVGINMQQYWSYSLDVAKVSRSLAGVVRQNQQAAFTAGLIHYVGELVMRLVMPAEMARLDGDIPALDARRAEVAAGLARQWLFPEPIVEALACQDTPFLEHAYEPLAGVLHLAAWRGRCKDASLNQREMAVSFPGAVGDVLLLDIDMVLQQDPIDWTSPRSQ